MLKVFDRYKKTIKKYLVPCLSFSLFGIILLLNKGENYSNWMLSIGAGLLIFSFLSFVLIESKFKKSLGYVYISAISAFMGLLFYSNIDSDVLVIAFIGEILLAMIWGIYFNYKNSKLEIGDYANGVISNGITSGLVTIIIVIEILIISLFCDWLLDISLSFIPFDYISFIVLPPVFYSIFIEPKSSNVLTKVMTYVFSPALFIFYIITFFFIFKCIGDGVFTVDKVFTITSVVFLASFAMYFLTRREKDNISKINSKIYYLFIPLLLTQIYTLFVRIYEYGLTSSRYFGIFFIIFELGFIINELLKKSTLFYFAYSAIIVIVLFILPFTNIQYFPLYTQSRLLKKYDLFMDVTKRMYAAYDYVADNCYLYDNLCIDNILSEDEHDKFLDYENKYIYLVEESPVSYIAVYQKDGEVYNFTLKTDGYEYYEISAKIYMYHNDFDHLLYVYECEYDSCTSELIEDFGSYKYNDVIVNMIEYTVAITDGNNEFADRINPNNYIE